MPWLREDELRIGLGCMRLEPDDTATMAAAVAAGVTVFDTARAYEGGEELLARALEGVTGARVVTKGGMSRPDGAWLPDGRAKAIRADCEASLAALGGREIDLYLLHTPDPRTPWSTSVRALGRLLDEGLVARIGICNVTRAQLDEAVDIAPVAAVQVGLSVLDDRALRGAWSNAAPSSASPSSRTRRSVGRGALEGSRSTRQLSRDREGARRPGGRGRAGVAPVARATCRRHPRRASAGCGAVGRPRRVARV